MLLNFMRRILPPPAIDEQEKKSAVRTLQTIVIVSMFGAAMSFLVASSSSGTIQARLVMAGLFLLLTASLFLIRRNILWPAQLLTPTALFATISYLAVSGNGLHDVSFFGYAGVIIVASLTLGQGATYIFAGLVIITSWVIARAELNGLLVSPGSSLTDQTTPVFITILVFAITFTQQALVNRMNENLQRARLNEQKQVESNKELIELQSTLEKRVDERTTELGFANQRNEKRARQFEAIAQVARATTANQKLETLLPSLAELISKQFGFYHTGIFLIDENREFAELRATNSDGGKRMLARGHKLAIGQSGIVGFVSATGKPRIALDVEADAAFFNNPDLPNTHSEMALPLQAADQVIGVLDVQSIASNAFQEEDIDVLSTLADQVAIAIQNARSFERSQELLTEAQRTSGEFLRESWRVLQSQEESLGYQVIENKLKPLSKPIASSQIKKAMTTKATVTENGEKATLAIPIRLRDSVIGVMDIRVPDEHDWDADEIDVAEAVAERLSLALEASLLLKSTQRQAEIERITAEISTKIGATTQFDSILRTAAEELSRVLGGSDVVVQIQSDVLETQSGAEQAQVKE